MTNKDNDYGIPTFLLRGHPDCIVGKTETVKQVCEEKEIPLTELTLRDEFLEGPAPSMTEVAREFIEAHELMHKVLAPRKLNAAFRSRVAMAIIGQVKAGADTFGKLRKALPDYNDRELKSGIRYAEKWMPMLERRGTNRKPVMHKYHARVERQGKRYSVVTY